MANKPTVMDPLQSTQFPKYMVLQLDSTGFTFLFCMPSVLTVWQSL